MLPWWELIRLVSQLIAMKPNLELTRSLAFDVPLQREMLYRSQGTILVQIEDAVVAHDIGLLAVIDRSMLIDEDCRIGFGSFDLEAIDYGLTLRMIAPPPRLVLAAIAIVMHVDPRSGGSILLFVDLQATAWVHIHDVTGAGGDSLDSPTAGVVYGDDFVLLRIGAKISIGINHHAVLWTNVDRSDVNQGAAVPAAQVALRAIGGLPVCEPANLAVAALERSVHAPDARGHRRSADA